MNNDRRIYEYYKRQIYRIGWRVQYKAKKIRRLENPFYDINHDSVSFVNTSDQKLWISQLINELPLQGRIILSKLYFEDLTEAEVAKQLNISQQAVNKWKRKMLQRLSQTVNY